MAQAQRWYRPSLTFLSILGGIALILFSVYMWGFQAVMYVQLRQESKKLAILNYVPEEIAPVEPSNAKGVTLTSRGFAFEAPWNDLNLEKSKSIGTWAIFAFNSGLSVTFCTPSTVGADLRDVVAKEFGGDRKKLEVVFGKDQTSSEYAFHKALLNTTTANVKPWKSSAQVARAGMMLMFKATSSVGGESGLYKVTANGWRGFQFDDPLKKANQVALELYDPEGGHVEIVLTVRKGASNPPTQSEINRILLSLHRTRARDTLTPKETEKVAAN